MRGLALILILLVFTTSADARRRHHHGRHFDDRQVLLPAPDVSPRDARDRDAKVAALVRRDWQLQPASPAWQGRRYVSPDGSAWIAFYATNAANDAEARFKAVAFGDGEELTYVHGERDRLTASGLKG